MIRQSTKQVNTREEVIQLPSDRDKLLRQKMARKSAMKQVIEKNSLAFSEENKGPELINSIV